MIKQYKAISNETCIKKFEPTLDAGWYLTTQEALSNFSATMEEQPKRVGRSRKSASGVTNGDSTNDN